MAVSSGWDKEHVTYKPEIFTRWLRESLLTFVTVSLSSFLIALWYSTDYHWVDCLYFKHLDCLYFSFIINTTVAMPSYINLLFCGCCLRTICIVWIQRIFYSSFLSGLNSVTSSWRVIMWSLCQFFFPPQHWKFCRKQRAHSVLRTHKWS